MSQTATKTFSELCRCIIGTIHGISFLSNQNKINYCIQEKIGSLGVRCIGEKKEYYRNFSECINYYSQNCDINKRNINNITDPIILGVLIGSGAFILFLSYKIVFGYDRNLSFTQRLKNLLFEIIDIVTGAFSFYI